MAPGGMNGHAFHHKDGKGWTASQTGSKSYPIDAWAAAPDDVWLVGDDGMILNKRQDARTPASPRKNHTPNSTKENRHVEVDQEPDGLRSQPR
jgi:hypothetical protein